MHPAIIKGHTHRFTAPEGRPEVVTLFVREDNEDGFQMLRSAWEAEQAEVGMLLAGAKLHLGMAVAVHPVVNLMVADLPEDFDPVFTARSFRCSKRGAVLRVEAFIPRSPNGLRIWVEQPIVAGFAAAFAASVAEIEKKAREAGVTL